jgi:hypothetical protein
MFYKIMARSSSGVIEEVVFEPGLQGVILRVLAQPGVKTVEVCRISEREFGKAIRRKHRANPG